MNEMSYKNYHAKISYSEEDETFFGEVIGLTDKLIFEGCNVEELKTQFHICVDEYLEMCEAIGKEPEKEFKGSLNIRISPETHRKLAIKAQREKISLNKLIDQALTEYVDFGGVNDLTHWSANAYTATSKKVSEYNPVYQPAWNKYQSYERGEKS